MKPLYFIQIVASFALLLFSLQSQAATWYHVELIVFEQLNTITDEQWPHMPEDKVTSLTLTPQSKSRFIRPSRNSTLLTTASRLNNSSAYRVHYHSSWQQPIMSKRSAKAVKIHSGNGLIDGNIKLYKSTYLHAAVDLWLLENTQPQKNSWSDSSATDENINTVRNPNLNESRRIRSKKLFFFDHPKMGALLKITPIKSPSSARKKEVKLESFSLPTEAASIATE